MSQPPATSEISKKPKRRWLRFSLRGLLIVVTLICLWLGWCFNAANRQKLAVQKILLLGGQVAYDYQADLNWHFGKCLLPGDQPETKLPDWLASRLGIDFFHDVHSVTCCYPSRLNMPSPHVPLLAECRAFPKLRKLQIAERIRPGDLAGIAELSRLQAVQILANDPLTDEDLAHFSTLYELQRVRIPNSRITDAGLRHLAGLTNLEVLELAQHQIRGPGLSYLRNLPKLKHLDLSHGPLEDEALQELAYMRSLEIVDLAGTAVTDAGVKHLPQLTRLRELNLCGTAITDACIDDLAKLRQLELIKKFRSEISYSGGMELFTKMPHCKVH